MIFRQPHLDTVIAEEAGQLVALHEISNSGGLTRERGSNTVMVALLRWPNGAEARRDVCGHRPESV